jgi:2-keto-4-pentenoate hydratase/2-oxohepta-3-ene-1,7-dioic acid hydratase in catechol pathway
MTDGRPASLRFARFRHGRRQGYALVEGELLRPIVGSPFGRWRSGEETVSLSGVRLLAPARPSKILAVALNYRSHLDQFDQGSAPANPELFLKPPSALIGPEEAIVLPPTAERVDYEGELVAVIGRRARDLKPDEALAYVLGYTCGNDVSARDWQQNDVQWWRAKGCDTFAPLGPWIATNVDPTNLELQTRVNGEVVQRTSTSLLIHDVARLVSFASQVMTLEPGDLLFTGTPGMTAPLRRGDVVEVGIGGIGVLRNHVETAV